MLAIKEIFGTYEYIIQQQSTANKSKDTRPIELLEGISHSLSTYIASINVCEEVLPQDADAIRTEVLSIITELEQFLSKNKQNFPALHTLYQTLLDFEEALELWGDEAFRQGLHDAITYYQSS